MKKTIYVLIIALLACTLSVGCNINDQPQDAQNTPTVSAQQTESTPSPSPTVIPTVTPSPFPTSGQTTPPPQHQGNTSNPYIDPLYEAFLNNEINVANPHPEGIALSVMIDEAYESEFEEAQKSYTFVDMNGDGKEELIFRISSYPSELMYILGIYDGNLICFDIYVTHSRRIGFTVYDNGLVCESASWDGYEMNLYTYTTDGKPIKTSTFTDEDAAYAATEQYNPPEWIDWNTFANH